MINFNIDNLLEFGYLLLILNVYGSDYYIRSNPSQFFFASDFNHMLI